MEELKEIISVIEKLPTLALWVIAGFWAYKVIFIGSVYGVIRFVIEKLHSWLVTPKHELKTIEIRPMLDGIAISGQLEPLIAQLHRVRMHVNRHNPSLMYMHENSVTWLRAAIDEKLEREKQ